MKAADADGMDAKRINDYAQGIKYVLSNVNDIISLPWCGHIEETSLVNFF